ncbi:hypothetical protein BDR07DRAFT_1437074 [Suillus spraguei]|nr:hypothetical protein BDR07DRAFT_1437074 [Suillus spraguei]
MDVDCYIYCPKVTQCKFLFHMNGKFSLVDHIIRHCSQYRRLNSYKVTSNLALCVSITHHLNLPSQTLFSRNLCQTWVRTIPMIIHFLALGLALVDLNLT